MLPDIIKPEHALIEDLTMLNAIAETLNRNLNVHSALSTALAQLIELMGLQTGWIFIKDETKQNRWAGRGYELIAHHNLPPAMKLNDPIVWGGGCDCQGLCNEDGLKGAYNQVLCSRLASAHGNTYGLKIHATVPLQSGETLFGILNVASESWEEFTPRMLALLTNVGSQMGVTLERARLYDLLKEQRSQEQRVFLDLSYHMLGRPDLDSMMAYLVTEVRQLLKVDGCALLLADDEAEYIYFRAVSGWKSNPISQKGGFPKKHSKVMRTQQPLVVEDIEYNDPTPWMSDWFKGESFRGHAVVPLVVQHRSIGLMVVNTREPRLLNTDEMRLLQLLANQAALALEKTRLYQQDLKNKRLHDELEVGQRIQRSMLPNACPKIHGWQFCSIYEPAKQVGGDFYDFFRLHHADYALGIVVGDAADKGVPAALVMALSRTIIRNTAMSKKQRSPMEALARANELMLEDSRSDMFLTAFYAILDTDTGWLTFSNAGHNPPLWYRAELDAIQPLALKGMVLGILDEIHLEEEIISMAANDILVLYTDGVTEAMSEQLEEFGVARLKEIIQAHAHETVDEIQIAIVDSIHEFMGSADQSDDYTLVIIKREAF